MPSNTERKRSTPKPRAKKSVASKPRRKHAPAKASARGSRVRRPLIGPNVTDYSMPAGVSTFGGGSSYSFGPGTRPGAVTVRFRVPFTGVGLPGGTAGVAGYPSGLIAQTQGTLSIFGVPQTTLAFNPVRMLGIAPTALSYTNSDCYMDSSQLSLTALGFTRYRFLSNLRFDYNPMCGTGTNSLDFPNFSFAVASDLFQPVIGVPAFTSTNAPTQAGCRSGANSMDFAGWKPWTMSFPVDQKSEYYTYYNSLGGSTISGNVRLSFPFIITCVANTITESGSNEPVPKGVLYLTSAIEFFDPMPLVPTFLSAVIDPVVQRFGLTAKGFTALNTAIAPPATETKAVPARGATAPGAPPVFVDLEDGVVVEPSPPRPSAASAAPSSRSTSLKRTS